MFTYLFIIYLVSKAKIAARNHAKVIALSMDTVMMESANVLILFTENYVIEKLVSTNVHLTENV